MKVNKSNPLHWIYLFIFTINTLLVLFLRIFLRKRNDTAILYGHKLNGNLKALQDYSLHTLSNTRLIFLTMDPSYYRILHGQGKLALLALNPLHMLKLVPAYALISDHGLHSLQLFLEFSDLKFIDVWHGIPFKGFDSGDFKVQHRYNEVWVTSKRIKQLYADKFGFSDKTLKITGYARTDELIRNSIDQLKIKEKLDIEDVNRRVILFAPTWQQDHNHRSIFPFEIKEDVFLCRLNDFCLTQDAICIFRNHLNTNSGSNKKYERILYRSYENFPDAEEVLMISDVLICDWSSIAFDFLLLNRPTLFLDVPPPFSKGFSLDASYRFGKIVQNIDEMFRILKNCLDNPHEYDEQCSSAIQAIRTELYDDMADGNASERCFRRLLELR